MKVSIVVNTYNRMHTLPRTLKSLSYLRYPFLEVIVVNGPSSDGTSEYLSKEWASAVKILSLNEANLSKSRNIGLGAASGEIVCFLDDDGIPEPDWIDHLVTQYCDETVAAVGGWVRDHTGVSFQTKFIISGRDTVSDVLVTDMDKVPVSKPQTDRFPGLIGVNSSFRRSYLIEVGGFDESYAYFLDETDVIVRLVDHGYKVKIVPEAQVHHKYAPSHIRAKSGIPKSLTQIASSTSYFIIKNALPKNSMLERFEKIQSIKRNWLNHTNWLLDNDMIDFAECNRLQNEFELGTAQGIRTAFQFPLGQLMRTDEVSPWKIFKVPLNLEDRLKVAFVSALYPPRPCGGVAIFIHSLAVELAKQGHEVTVITQADGTNPHTVDFEDGVWVHRLPSIRESDSSNLNAMPDLGVMPDMPPKQFQDAVSVLKELDRVNGHRNFDLVVGAIWDLDIAAVISSKRYRTAIYLVTSYKLMEESKKEWSENVDFYQNHFLKMVNAEAWALAETDHILASTEAILADCQKAYSNIIDHSKVSIIPFGLPDKNMVSSSSEKADITILFVGRLEYRKGIDQILEIAPSIIQDHPNVSFRIVGDNTLIDSGGVNYMNKFCSEHANKDWLERVRFLGHVDEETLDMEYRDCDIFIAPSRYESFGLIYLEAMRHGKPCIGTTAGGIPEVIVDGQTGLTVEPSNSNELRAAIDQLVSDRDYRLFLGRNGKMQFEQRFTIEKFATNFLSFSLSKSAPYASEALQKKPVA